MAFRIRHNTWEITIEWAVARYVVLMLFAGAFCLGFLTGRIDAGQFISIAVTVMATFGLMGKPVADDPGTKTHVRRRSTPRPKADAEEK